MIPINHDAHRKGGEDASGFLQMQKRTCGLPHLVIHTFHSNTVINHDWGINTSRCPCNAEVYRYRIFSSWSLLPTIFNHLCTEIYLYCLLKKIKKYPRSISMEWFWKEGVRKYWMTSVESRASLLSGHLRFMAGGGINIVFHFSDFTQRL